MPTLDTVEHSPPASPMKNRMFQRRRLFLSRRGSAAMVVGIFILLFLVVIFIVLPLLGIPVVTINGVTI